MCSSDLATWEPGNWPRPTPSRTGTPSRRRQGTEGSFHHSAPSDHAFSRMRPAVRMNQDGSRAASASKVMSVDRQGWITLLAALLLALITLFSSYDHVDIPGAAGSFPLPQQAGIPCLLAALATAALETQLASNDRQEGRAVQARAESDRIRAENDRIRAAQDRARAEDAAARERGRAAGRARRQDRCTLAQLEFQLDPGPTSRQRLTDLIALLREYGEPI